MKLAAMPSTTVHCDLAGDRGIALSGLARQLGDCLDGLDRLRLCEEAFLDEGAGEGHQERQGVRAAQKLSAEREAAVRAALAAGTGIRRTARLVGTGNATVARIAAEMRGG
jgi:hypothetical protein